MSVDAFSCSHQEAKEHLMVDFDFQTGTSNKAHKG